MSHTKEPWSVEIEIWDEDGPEGSIEIHPAIVMMHDCEWASPDEFARDEANARRIVACVNDCEGIADTTAIPFGLRVLEAIANVDLERLAESSKDTFCKLEHFSERAKEALAKLKGGAA